MFEIQLRRNKMSKGKNIALENRGLFLRDKLIRKDKIPCPILIEKQEITLQHATCNLLFPHLVEWQYILRKKTHSTEYLIYCKNSSINSPNPLECELDGMLLLKYVYI